ncbi:uncharacterized protein DEA37_0009147 [Paragonimus westermani]|uniref:Dynein light chain 1, cytoplasmic n=1 Tax=Paragonimus westermani TaxID=34504 RepID=A0A5J4NLU7_9TREM|nr:uncharacterized protein DEA37_0009147 [Paragonimus westermani]
MLERRAIIKNADMPENMQQEAADCCGEALDKFTVEKDIAAYVKKEFDRLHQPTWHCVVGRQFGRQEIPEAQGRILQTNTQEDLQNAGEDADAETGDQPIGATSHCVYQFTCNCNESYIGRTERCLISRVKEHLPNWVQNSVLRKNDNVVETRKQPASAVARHVLTTGHVINPICAFRILLRHSNPRFLRFAEAVAINRMKPTLCVQKQLLVTDSFEATENTDSINIWGCRGEDVGMQNNPEKVENDHSNKQREQPVRNKRYVYSTISTDNLNREVNSRYTSHLNEVRMGKLEHLVGKCSLHNDGLTANEMKQCDDKWSLLGAAGEAQVWPSLRSSVPVLSRHSTEVVTYAPPIKRKLSKRANAVEKKIQRSIRNGSASNYGQHSFAVLNSNPSAHELFSQRRKTKHCLREGSSVRQSQRKMK